MDLEIVAIDGTGRQTSNYLSLLKKSTNLINANSALLISSDSTAYDPEVRCEHIPNLDYHSYSRFCVEKLADYTKLDYCLTIQLDGFILNPNLWSNNFFNYDFIGAPWKSKPHRPIKSGQSVGNGGFSLRSKRYLKVSQNFIWQPFWNNVIVPDHHQGNEDYFLNIIQREKMINEGISFAPEEVALKFAIHAGDKLNCRHRMNNTFGFHGKGLVRKAKRYTLKRDLKYAHLLDIKPSIFPLGY